MLGRWVPHPSPTEVEFGICCEYKEYDFPKASPHTVISDFSVPHLKSLESECPELHGKLFVCLVSSIDLTSY